MQEGSKASEGRVRKRPRLGTPRMLMAGLVLIAASGLGTGPASAEPASPSRPVAPATPRLLPNLLVNHEHVDALSVGFEDGALSLQAAADLESGRGQLFDASEVLLQVKDVAAARLEVPAGFPEFAFLGPPGTPLWVAPMTQNPEVVWPGWNTERLDAGVFVDDAVHLHLRDVEGPGHVEVFMDDPFGLPIRILSSTDPSLRTHTTSIGTHAHANWSFDALGTYTLTFEATATTVGGTEVRTGPVEYRWRVGSLPTTTELAVSPPTAGAGDDVTLTAQVGTEAVPETGLPGTVTFLDRLDGGTVVGEAPLEDGGATLVTDDLAAGAHDLVARFTPDAAAHVGDAFVGSDSPAVPYTVSSGDPDPDPDPGPDPDPDPDPDPPGECPIEAVLDVGHVDIAARIVDGELVTQVKDTTRGGPPVWRDLETVAFHARPEARTQVPPGGTFDFIGPPGSDVWMLPQVQDPELLWPGWNTEEIDYSRLDGGVTWSLAEVTGPGDLAVYQVGDFGEPQVVFDSSEPLPQPVGLGEPTHAHGTWAFDAEGIYRLAFRHTARLGSGGQLSSGGELAVAVGDVDLDGLCPGGGVPDPPDDPNDPNDPGDPGDPGDPNDPGDPADPGDPSDPPGGTTTSTPSGGVECRRPRPSSASQDGDGDADGGAQAAGDAVVLDAGHVDYAARIVDGDLVSQVKDGTVAGTTEWRDPGSVVFHVKPAASTEVPPGERFGFLGSAGATIWQIPQTQDPDLLWLGWNTEEIAAGQVDGPVTWKLEALDGPGDLAVYTLGSFGQPTVLFDEVGDRYQVPLGTHAHGSWAFTAEGVYRARFTHSARLASGRTVRDTATLTFAVGATDPTAIGPTATAPTSTTSTTPDSDDDGVAGDCRLPRTGSDVDGLVAAGGLLVGAGSGTALAARRLRRRRA